jgi:lactobin A/cerein 7B family class IIb bacteriocin
MKTNYEKTKCFEEVTSSEAQMISGGVVPEVLLMAGAILAPIAAACAISYYVGYGVGKLMCDK